MNISGELREKIEKFSGEIKLCGFSFKPGLDGDKIEVFVAVTFTQEISSVFQADLCDL